MSDVFVSYSRKDKVFVQKLHEALKAQGRETWVDWEDIPLTADWWAEIQEGIETANAFVFIISPDSVISEVCGQELDHAINHNKRLIPLVYREAKDVPASLGHINWIFFRATDDFEEAFQKLLTTMDTDLEWVKAHTRLTRRAVEWDRKGRNDSYLLRGDDLAEAEYLFTQTDKKPAPTQLHQEYILASQRVQADEMRDELAQAQALAETERRLKEKEQHHNTQLRRRGLVIIGALVTVIILGLVALVVYIQNATLLTGTERIVETMVGFGDAQANSDLCWAGALNEMSTAVMPACDRAIALDPEYADFYESRGLALAMTDDFASAIADFRRAIALAEQDDDAQDLIEEWQDWIAQLEQESNPFDKDLLQKLREDWADEIEEYKTELEEINIEE